MSVIKNRFKLILIILSVLLTTALTVNSTLAYVLQAGKLNKGVVNQTYYVGIDNQTLSAECVKAFADWNYAVQNTNETRNMGFSFTRSDRITGTTIRCWAENQTNQEWYGITKFYTLDSKLNATEVEHYNNRDYADCIINLRFYDWTYTEPTRLQWKSIMAHEIGHALGLLHTNSDGDVGKLMYQGFNVRTATSATRDEVLGIYHKYS